MNDGWLFGIFVPLFMGICGAACDAGDHPDVTGLSDVDAADSRSGTDAAKGLECRNVCESGYGDRLYDTSDQGTDAASCISRKDDRISIALGPYRGMVYGCSLSIHDAGAVGYTADLSFNGAVSALDAQITDAGRATMHLEIDTCSVGDGCQPEIVSIDIASSGPSPEAALRVGSFVSVTYHLGVVSGCSQSVTIHNLSEWNGHLNPVSSMDVLLLVASDGFAPPVDGEASSMSNPPDFYVTRVAENCGVVGNGCGVIAAGDYALRFSEGAGRMGASVLVHMGEGPVRWMVEQQAVAITDLRSYQTTICDDYMNWAFLLSTKLQ